MKMRVVSIKSLFLVMICSVLSMHSASCYNDQAANWCSKVIKATPDHEEKILLLNLLYWSWQYSASIMTLQETVVEYVKRSGNMVNETMSARLNPAQISSILHHDSARWERDCAAFERAHKVLQRELKRYRSVAATYAQCTEYLIKTGDIRAEIKDLIKLVRQQSRAVRMVVWQEQFTSVSSIMDNLKKVMGSLDNHVRDGAVDASRGFLDCIVQYAVPGAFNSFAKFDTQYNAFNAKVWNTLVSSYAMSNVLWETTEKVRADFYKEHYELLLRLLSGPAVQKNLLVAAFDADGFVEGGRRDIS